jgi:hypothetical protein
MNNLYVVMYRSSPISSEKGIRVWATSEEKAEKQARKTCGQGIFITDIRLGSSEERAAFCKRNTWAK